MRANRTYGSEGGESQTLPDPYHVFTGANRRKTWMAGTSPRLSGTVHAFMLPPACWRKFEVLGGALLGA